MRFNFEGFGERFHDVRHELVDRMERYLLRYNTDVPGVLSSMASIFMVGLALTFVFQARG